MEIGSRLKALRKERKETQLQVAQAIGMGDRHYQRIENDEGLPGLEIFCALAELLPVQDPARRERDREDHDERGAMIRAMARARAGDVLLWLLLFGAAYLYFFGVPKWVNITLLGLACVKLLLDWMFTVWYRRQY